MWGDGEVTRRKSRARALPQEDGSRGGVLIQLNKEQVSLSNMSASWHGYWLPWILVAMDACCATERHAPDPDSHLAGPR